jgi:peptidoglycan/LPS O-acetylase OafA/YrhL
MKPNQIPSLTGLRFFAAMIVVLSHAIPKIVIYDNPPYFLRVLSQASAAGMTLFFVLSGFVIFLNYSRLIGTGTDLWNFFVARFARLYPLFFVCVAFDLLMTFSYNQMTLERLAALPFYATLTQSWVYEVIGNHSLIFQYGLMPQVSWSISTEWMFYFAFPFICGAILLLRTARTKLLGAVALSAFALIVITLLNFHADQIQAFGIRTFGPIAATQTDSFHFWLTYFSPYVRIFEFVLGCICASMYLALDEPSPREQRIGAALTFLSLAAIAGLQLLFLGVRFENPYFPILQQLYLNYGFAPAAALLVFSCARCQNAIVRFMSGKWIVLEGETSYSIYLLHDVIINAFRYEAAKITSWNVAMGAYLQLAVVLGATAGISLISWRFIEVPCRSILRSILSVEPARVRSLAT